MAFELTKSALAGVGCTDVVRNPDLAVSFLRSVEGAIFEDLRRIGETEREYFKDLDECRG